MSEQKPGAAADENPVIDWARAIALGVRDTAKDILEAGRAGAREAYREKWREFDRKTRSRRKHTD